MKQTDNYQLSLWDPTDRILREKFNEDNRKIDAALAARAGGLEVIEERKSDGSPIYTTSAPFPTINWDEWDVVCLLVHYPEDGGGSKTVPVDFGLTAPIPELWRSKPLAQPGYLVVLLPRHDGSANISGFLIADKFYPIASNYPYQDIRNISLRSTDYDLSAPTPSILIFGRK